MSVLHTCSVYYEWYSKCAPREPVVWGSASQTVGGIFECRLSVSIRAFPGVGCDPEGSLEINFLN